jgi:hypothetical protein
MKHFSALSQAKNFKVILKLWSHEAGLPSGVFPRNWDSADDVLFDAMECLAEN